MGQYVSKLGSWLVWRETLKGGKMRDLTGVDHPNKQLLIKKLRERYSFVDGDICPICDGWGETVENGQNVLCVCAMAQWETELQMGQLALFPKPRNAHLGDLKVYQDPIFPNHKVRLTNFLTEITEWVIDPKHWLLISGPVGTGKSHVLHALANLFYPLAVYVPATEFESNIFNWLSEKTLETNMDILKRAPILLFDDYKADYGAEFPSAKLRSLIDWRYQHSQETVEYPTIVVTNEPIKALMGAAMSGDRIASRILDKGISRTISLDGVADFRLKARG